MNTAIQKVGFDKLAVLGVRNRAKLSLGELIVNLIQGVRLRKKLACLGAPPRVGRAINRSVEGTKAEIEKHLVMLYKEALNEERQKTASMNRALEESFEIKGEQKDGTGTSTKDRF